MATYQTSCRTSHSTTTGFPAVSSTVRVPRPDLRTTSNARGTSINNAYTHLWSQSYGNVGEAIGPLDQSNRQTFRSHPSVSPVGLALSAPTAYPEPYMNVDTLPGLSGAAVCRQSFPGFPFQTPAQAEPCAYTPPKQPGAELSPRSASGSRFSVGDTVMSSGWKPCVVQSVMIHDNKFWYTLAEVSTGLAYDGSNWQDERGIYYCAN